MNIKIFQNGEYLIEEAEKVASAPQYKKQYPYLGHPKLQLDFNPDPDPDKKQRMSDEEEEEENSNDKCSESVMNQSVVTGVEDQNQKRWNKCWTIFVQVPFKIFSYLEILIPLWLIHSQLLTDVLTEDWSKFKVDTSAFTFLWIFAIISYEWTKLSAILQLRCIQQKNKAKLSFLLGIKSLQIAVSSTLLLLSRLGVFISSDCGIPKDLTECKHCRIVLVLLTVNILSFLSGHFFHSFSSQASEQNEEDEDQNQNQEQQEKEQNSKALWAGQFLQIYSHLEIWLSILVAIAVVVNWENFCKFWDPTRIASMVIPIVYLAFLVLKFGVAITQLRLRLWRDDDDDDDDSNYGNGGNFKGLIACLGFHMLTFMLMLGFFIFCLVCWNDTSGYGTAVPLTPSLQFGLLPLEITVMTQIPCFILGFIFYVQLRRFNKSNSALPILL